MKLHYLGALSNVQIYDMSSIYPEIAKLYNVVDDKEKVLLT